MKLQVASMVSLKNTGLSSITNKDLRKVIGQLKSEEKALKGLLKAMLNLSENFKTRKKH